MSDAIRRKMDGLTINYQPAATLATLPFDIQRLIVWSEKLSQEDVASLRLVCRALTNVAATRLFYRIAISKLKTDRESFLSICHSPHLASHVHEVVWLEVSWDAESIDRLQARHAMKRRTEFDDDVEDSRLFRYLKDAAAAAFWLPNVPTHPLTAVFDGSKIVAERQRAVAEFRETFLSAIDQLPNLHTFISRPMDSTMIIHPDSEYPMTAGLLHPLQDVPQPPQEPQANDGLFLFLLPAMERPTSTVTRMRWADEFPGFSYLRPLPASAFNGLETLSLCLTPPRHKQQIAVSGLEAACSRAAPTLRNLRFCLEHGFLDPFPGALERVLLGDALVTSPQCALVSLTLISVRITTDSLTKIIKSNARSLRRLHLEGIAVKVKVIQQLADLGELKLKTMRVAEDDGTTVVVCEHAVLRYINGEEPDKDCPCREDDADYVDDYNDCDGVVRDMVKMEESRRFVTANITFTEEPASEASSDDASECSDSSEDSVLQRVRTGPKWIWGRFFNDAKYGFPDIYCYHVSDSHPKGHPTKIWKFTSRNGEVAYGDDPLTWFDEWDTGAGDVEEPTPYCDELRKFHRDGQEVEYRVGSLFNYLGDGSKCWDLVRRQHPPKGAVLYDPEEDAIVYMYRQD